MISMAGHERAGIMRRIGTILFLMAFAAFIACGDEREPDETDTAGSVVIDVGGDEPEGSLGFGWSHREHEHERAFRWIEHLEADVWFELDEVSDLNIRLRAAPLHLYWKRQNIGVYVNQRFVTEWLCPDRQVYREYQALIPTHFLKPGKNRLTLRMGYRYRVPPDPRERALAVERIVFEPL